MYACKLSTRLLRFSIKNVSKWLDYPIVVHRGLILAFSGCCHPPGRLPETLEAEKHSLIEEPLIGAVFESVARHTGIWRDRVANVCWASVNWCIFHLDGQTWHGLGACLLAQCQTLDSGLTSCVYYPPDQIYTRSRTGNIVCRSGFEKLMKRVGIYALLSSSLVGAPACFELRSDFVTSCIAYMYFMGIMMHGSGLSQSKPKGIWTSNLWQYKQIKVAYPTCQYQVLGDLKPQHSLSIDYDDLYMSMCHGYTQEDAKESQGIVYILTALWLLVSSQTESH